MEEEKVGFVSNYFSKISVAAVEITDGTLSVGDTLHFLGHTTDFESRVHSMQIEHKSVTEAIKGSNPPEGRRASLRLALVSSRQIGAVLTDEEERVRIRNE